jgi:hypothetical protein
MAVLNEAKVTIVKTTNLGKNARTSETLSSKRHLTTDFAATGNEAAITLSSQREDFCFTGEYQ